MLLIVSIPGETTVPPVHRGCEGSKRLVECSLKDEWWHGGPPRGAPRLAIFWGSSANGGLMYRLVEDAKTFQRAKAWPNLPYRDLDLLRRRGLTAYPPKRMIR